MQVHYDPDEFETVVVRRTCPFHQEAPNESFPGCTCSTAYSTVRRTVPEIAAIKAERRRKEEDAILAKAALIRAQRRSS